MDHDAPGQVERMVHEQAACPKERRRDPIFVHSTLDDYGLSLIEFRLCARVARRGSCYESLASLANNFQVSEQTIRRAFRVLVRCKILKEARTAGRSTEFTLNPSSDWAHPSKLKEIRESVFGKPPKRRHRASRKKHAVSTPNSRVTPYTGDRGTTREPGVRTPGTGVPLTPSAGLPLTPGVDEGTPVEGTPVERSLIKVIPHTPKPEPNEQGGVCVPTSMDLINLDKEEDNPWDTQPLSRDDVAQYVYYRLHQGDRIHTPTGLIKTILKNRVPHEHAEIKNTLMKMEIERKAQQVEREREEAARLQLLKELDEKFAEEERRKADEAEAKRQREIIEAPRRKREREAQEASEREAEARGWEIIKNVRKRKAATG